MSDIRFLSILIFTLLSGGCGERYVGVSGRVTVDGEPKENIRVLFTWNDDAKPSADTGVGVTDAEGRYRLTSLLKEKGGMEPGTYSVTFKWQDPDLPKDLSDDAVIPPPPFFLSKEAIDGNMVFTVLEKTMPNADFDLKSSDKPVKLD